MTLAAYIVTECWYQGVSLEHVTVGTGADRLYHFILWESNEMQQLAVCILFHCKITLHVSGAVCTHHHEYIKLQMQPLVQVMWCGR
jgi:hypothetical protein